jgi:hypothetical protein
MAGPKRESRSEPRLTVRLPVSLKCPDGAAPAVGHTRDLSRNGVFLYTDAKVSEGSEVEIVLMLPPELNQGQSGWVCCQASIVRVEDGSQGGEVALAAKIRKMELLPEILGQ